MSNKRIEKAKNFDFSSWCDNQRKRNKALLSGRIFVVGLLWAIIISYLISPFSKASIVSYEGNYCVIDKQDVYTIGEFDDSTFWWNINLKDVEEKLMSYADGKYILDVDISYNINGIKVVLEENKIVGRFKNASDNYVYVLRDGTTFVDDSTLNTSQHYYDKKHLSETKNIPLVQKEIVESNTCKDVMEELSKFELLDKLGTIAKAKIYAEGIVEQYKLIFPKEKTGMNYDLEVYINLEDIVSVLSNENYPLLSAWVKDNKECLINNKYSVIYGPVSGGDNAYGFLPYQISE